VFGEKEEEGNFVRGVRNSTLVTTSYHVLARLSDTRNWKNEESLREGGWADTSPDRAPTMLMVEVNVE